MAKTNYSYEKRQQELKKQKKRQEKLQRKLDKNKNKGVEKSDQEVIDENPDSPVEDESVTE